MYTLLLLKECSGADAKSRVASWLDKFDLSAHSSKKVKELSKGMQQKAQLISALLHEPQIVIIDEPFSALDPVNTQMVKDILLELRKQNRTVVMCTHQMHQVEELCDRLVLIDHGKIMLYGGLGEIQNTYTGSDIILKSGSDLSSIGDIRIIEKNNGNTFKIALPENTNPQQFLRQLVQQNVDIEQFEVAVPTLDEIFIKIVKQGGNDKAIR